MENIGLGEVAVSIILLVLVLFIGKKLNDWYNEIPKRNKLQEEILSELKELKSILQKEDKEMQ